MKKLTLVLFAIALALQGFSQNDDYKLTITGGVGLTLSGALMTAVEGASLGTVEKTGLPNLELGLDYGVAKWFSVGLMGAYQSASLTEDFDGSVNEYTLSRMYIGTSLLFHYANSGRVDLFSGFRVGYKNWSYSSTIDAGSTDEIDFDDLSFFGDGLGVQVLLFGLRGYVTENIGINVEVLGIGAPHLSSIGLSCRF